MENEKTVKRAVVAPRAPRLTVCMPTYNRCDLLVTLIGTVLLMLKSTFGTDFEIVVSDNHSKDDTYTRVTELGKTESAIRVIRPPQHYPTAEENLCFALGECRGEYVWILGDDDAVEPSVVEVLKTHIDRATHDLIIFNSRSHSFEGQVLKNIRIECLAPELDIPLLDFVRLTGFWFVISGFSTTVMRRSALNLDTFQEIMAVGKIYAQVTWLISQFHDKPFVFVNKPLVAYRQNLSDVKATGHWEHVAKREKLFPRAIWTNGFLRQLDFLVERKVFDRSFVSTVVDRNLDRRFYFVDQVFLHMINTTIEWLDLKAQPIPPAECYYFLDWMKYLWPNNISFIAAMEALFTSVFEDAQFDRSQLDVAAAIINARIAMPWYMHFHRYDAYGFSVFEHCGQWFAIRQDPGVDIATWLEYVDFGDLAGAVFVRNDEASLLTALVENLPRLKLEKPIPVQTYLQAGPAVAPPADPRLASENIDLRAQLESSKRDHSVEATELKRQVEMWLSQLDLHKTRMKQLESQITEIKTSTSWRVSWPVRALGGLFKGR